MTFLKKLSRRFHSAVKFVDHSLAKAGHSLGKINGVVDLVGDQYHNLKNRLVEKVPELGSVFRAVEASPIGSAVRGARGLIQDGISDLGRQVKLAQSLSEEGQDKARNVSQVVRTSAQDFIQNPALNGFIHE